MTGPMLFRLAGLALIMPVPLWAVGQALHPRTEQLKDVLASSQSISHAIMALAFFAALLGLHGLYASHATRSGRLGLVAFVWMVAFAISQLYILLYEAGPVAALSRDAAAERLFADGGIVRQGMLQQFARPACLGTILYGFVLLRDGIYPRVAGWMLIAFLPAFLAFLTIPTFLSHDAQESLLDLGYANLALGTSYLLALGGLAIAGYQLMRVNMSVLHDTSRTVLS